MKSYFKNIEENILIYLSSAVREVNVAVSWFTNRNLFDKLLELLSKGIAINLIIINDNLNIREDGLDFQLFINKGGNLFFGDDEKLMHNKYCIIDDILLITGSYNWTYYAEARNLENIILIEDKEVIKEYIYNYKKIIKQIKKVEIINKTMVKEFLRGYEDIISIEEELEQANKENIINGRKINLFSLSDIFIFDISKNGEYLLEPNRVYLGVNIWTYVNGKKEKVISSYKITGIIYAGFMFDNEHIYMVSRNNKLFFYNFIKKEVVYESDLPNIKQELRKVKGGFGLISVAKKCNLIAIIDENGLIKIMNSAGKILFKYYLKEYLSIWTLSISDNGKYLLIGGQSENFGSTIKVLMVENGKCVQKYEMEDKKFGIRFIDGSSEFVYFNEHGIKVFDIKNKEQKITIKIFEEPYFVYCPWDVNDNYICLVSPKEQPADHYLLEIWNLKDGELQKKMIFDKGEIHSVKFHPKERLILTYIPDYNYLNGNLSPENIIEAWDY